MNAQDDKMMYRLFLTAVEKQLRSMMPPEYEIVRGKALKNNSVELDTIVIRETGEEVVPNIFLNPYYKSYIDGKSIEEIGEEIVGVYRANRNHFDIESFGDCSLDFFRDRIFFKLVNSNKNRALLEELPHVSFNNLVLIFACLIEHGSEGIASIRIDNNLMKKWNTDVHTLFTIASENTVRLFPPKIFELENHNINLLLTHRLNDGLIEDLLKRDENETGSADQDAENDTDTGIEEKKWIPDGIPKLFVLTNHDGVDGATCIVYNGLLERIKRRLGRGFYIIPSSVHEVLILPDGNEFNRESLEDMVREVNRTVLSEMDILSENVYYYPDDDLAVVV